MIVKELLQNLRTLEKNLNGIREDIASYDNLDPSIFGHLNGLCNSLNEQIGKCKEEKEAEITKSLQRVAALSEILKRFIGVCDGINNYQSKDKSDALEESTLQLMDKLAKEETAYTSKLMCLQRVSKQFFLHFLQVESDNIE